VKRKILTAAVLTVILAVAASVPASAQTLFRVKTQGIVWQDSTDIPLFDPGVMLQPGFERSGAQAFSFTVENTMQKQLWYSVTGEVWFSTGGTSYEDADAELTAACADLFEYRLYMDTEHPDARGGWGVSMLEAYDSLLKNEDRTWKLEWRWPFSRSSSQDSLDALAGAASADRNVKIYLRVTVYAEMHSDDDGKNPNTGDTAGILWPAAAVLSLGAIAAAVLRAKAPGLAVTGRREDREETVRRKRQKR